MKKTAKKILCWVLVLAMAILVANCPISVFATTTETAEEIHEHEHQSVLQENVHTSYLQK